MNRLYAFFALLLLPATCLAQRLELTGLEDFFPPNQLRTIAVAADHAPRFGSVVGSFGFNQNTSFRGRFNDQSARFAHAMTTLQLNSVQFNAKASWIDWQGESTFARFRGVGQFAFYLPTRRFPPEETESGRYVFSYITEQGPSGDWQTGYGISIQINMFGEGAGDYTFVDMPDGEYFEINFDYNLMEIGPVYTYWGIGYSHLWDSYRIPLAARNTWKAELAAQWEVPFIGTTINAVYSPSYASRQSRWHHSLALFVDRSVISGFLGRRRG